MRSDPEVFKLDPEIEAYFNQQLNTGGGREEEVELVLVLKKAPGGKGQPGPRHLGSVAMFNPSKVEEITHPSERGKARKFKLKDEPPGRIEAEPGEIDAPDPEEKRNVAMDVTPITWITLPRSYCVCIGGFCYYC